MLASMRAKGGLASVLRASHLLNSTTCAVAEASCTWQPGSSRVGASTAEPYSRWAQHGCKRSFSDQGDIKEHREQRTAGHRQDGRRSGGGGGGSGGGGWRDQRGGGWRDQRQQYDQAGSASQFRRRPRSEPGSDDRTAFRGNYRDPQDSSLDAKPYVRVAARPGQRQAQLFPMCLENTSPSLLRQDVVAFFDGYNLPEDEIRPQYSWQQFKVDRFWLNFSTAADRERALSRHLAYLGSRRVQLRKARPQEFTEGIYNPLAMSSRGRYVLVSGLAPTSTSEDVLRFFKAFDLHAKSVSFCRDPQNHGVGGSELAIVRFANQLEARRALRQKQGGFCGNTSVRLRVLQ